MNKLILIGNLGRDPEMRYTPSGQSVTSFSVACNRRYTTGAGEQREETDWFNVQAWGKLSEVCNQYLVKGQQVYVEGRLKLRTYERQDGKPGYSLDVTAEKVHFLSKGKSGGPTSESDSADDVDDLPF